MKKISMDFFRDEVRNGFFIPTAIKQAWASQLQILDVIDNICRKYGITYFADWGTMLGTVRHGGYVPWDDDMDICMKREDYTRFKEVAKTELPENFCIHDYEHHEDHWLFLARVVNNRRISFEPEHMKQYHNFPYLSGVDIFVLDYLYKDKEKEQKRCEEVKYIIAIADSIIAGEITEPAKEAGLIQLEQRYNRKFNRQLDNRHMGIELYRLAEEQMARVPESQSDRIAQLFPWGLLGRRIMDKKYYENFVRLPFENTTMPVPADYNKILTSKYNNYFQIRKIWGGHNYPYFESQRENLQAIADFKLPQFTFDKCMLRQYDSSDYVRDTMQSIAAEALLNIEELHKNIFADMQAGNQEHALDLLAKCQNVAIDLGNFIEQMKGENHPSAKICTTSLEEYCENIFCIYNELSQPEENISSCAHDFLNRLGEAFSNINQSVAGEITNKKLIAFLPDNPKRWDEMQALYDYYSNQEDTEVLVIPLPMFGKNPYGEIIATKDEQEHNDRRGEYPENLNIIPWYAIQMELYRFAAIIIQNPYDAENPCLTVPPQYYSKKLQKYTDCLIYMMPQHVNNFTEKDVTDMYGLKYSLAMPGAMYADKILIQSSSMKELFVNYLTGFAGENTRNIWNNKMMTMPVTSDITEFPKTILYCIGESEFCEDADTAIGKVKEKLDVFSKYQEQIPALVCLYPYDIASWDILTNQGKEALMQTLESYENGKGIRLAEKEKADIDRMAAYYGSPSPLVCEFVERHKPVMLS